jgi:co-chaperonin GroES (HSP10)
LDAEKYLRAPIVKASPQKNETLRSGGRDVDGERTVGRKPFAELSGTEINSHGEDLVIMKESDILGVMA